MMARVWIALALLLAGMVLGVGGTTWFLKGGEIRALKAAINANNEAMIEANARGMKIVTELEQAKANNRRLVTGLQREVDKHVKDNRACDYNQSARRMLNSARGYRLPEAAAELDAESGAAPAFTQPTATRIWIADIGEYNECVGQLNGLIDFITKGETP